MHHSQRMNSIVDNDTCSPSSSEYHKKHGRCVGDSDVTALATRLFKKSLSNLDPAKTYEELQKVLGDDPARWSDHPLLSNHRDIRHRLDMRFRPRKPASWTRDPKQWLTTSNINAVMQQYNDKSFRFLGAQPRDFAAHRECLVNDSICRPLDYRDQSRSKKRLRNLGIVMNLDAYGRSGSHWVSCYVSFDIEDDLYGVYYYDSNARPPLLDTILWMTSIRDEFLKSRDSQASRKTGKTREFEMRFNETRRQFMSYECGMFAMVFLIVAHKLKNKSSFDEICEKMPSDDAMSYLRGVLFRE